MIHCLILFFRKNVHGPTLSYTPISFLPTHDDEQNIKLLRTICRNTDCCLTILNFAGILCIVLGAVILVLDLRYPEAVTSFFGVDPLQVETVIEGVHHSLSRKKSIFEESNLPFTFTSDSV